MSLVPSGSSHFFAVARAPASADLLGNDAGKQKTAFMNRFGLTFVQKRNKDLVNMIADPVRAVESVDKYWADQAAKHAAAYKAMVDELTAKDGFSLELATQVADTQVAEWLEADEMFAKVKFPYSHGAEGALKELLTQQKQLTTANKIIANLNH